MNLNVESAMASKVRFIPSNSIGGNMILPAMKFKKITMITDKSKKDLDIYIAFVSDKTFGEYDAIISEETTI